MNQEEIVFVNKNYIGEIKLYYNAMKWICIVGMTLTILYLLMRSVFQHNDPTLPADPPYFTYGILGMMTVLLLLLIVLSYFLTIHKFYKDAKECKKIVEQCLILEKNVINADCTVRLDSIYFKQIQILPEDAHRYQAGDEINIEYALHSKHYFGYF